MGLCSEVLKASNPGYWTDPAAGLFLCSTHSDPDALTSPLGLQRGGWASATSAGKDQLQQHLGGGKRKGRRCVRRVRESSSLDFRPAHSLRAWWAGLRSVLWITDRGHCGGQGGGRARKGRDGAGGGGKWRQRVKRGGGAEPEVLRTGGKKKQGVCEERRRAGKGRPGRAGGQGKEGTND